MRKRLIDSQELVHRLSNGFISHDGIVDHKFVDIFEQNGITWDEIYDDKTPYGKMIRLVIDIIDSLPDEANQYEKALDKTCQKLFDEATVMGNCEDDYHYAKTPDEWKGWALSEEQ